LVVSDIVFPVVDVARLAVRNAEVNRMLCDGSAGEQFMTTLKSFLSAGVGTNVMLALRVLSNMFSHSPGESLALAHRDYLLAVLKDLRPPFTKPLEVSVVNRERTELKRFNLKVTPSDLSTDRL